MSEEENKISQAETETPLEEETNITLVDHANIILSQLIDERDMTYSEAHTILSMASQNCLDELLSEEEDDEDDTEEGEEAKEITPPKETTTEEDESNN